MAAAPPRPPVPAFRRLDVQNDDAIDIGVEYETSLVIAESLLGSTGIDRTNVLNPEYSKILATAPPDVANAIETLRRHAVMKVAGIAPSDLARPPRSTDPQPRWWFGDDATTQDPKHPYPVRVMPPSVPYVPFSFSEKKSPVAAAEDVRDALKMRIQSWQRPSLSPEQLVLETEHRKGEGKGVPKEPEPKEPEPKEPECDCAGCKSGLVRCIPETEITDRHFIANMLKKPSFDVDAVLGEMRAEIVTNGVAKGLSFERISQRLLVMAMLSALYNEEREYQGVDKV